MTGIEICLLPSKASDIFTRLIASARSRLMMNQSSKWRPHDTITKLSGSQTKVDVIVGDSKSFFVKKTQLFPRMRVR